ncbi:unnamed protein product [Cuscuta campestris]|uniref:Uncharacterized protein n=1 Tax=Cuscuta campestris TaxID=132261 RepID=A0A484KZF2_9ASTE|nr:unnamed protein product [Cuscuta campestris]
MTVSGSEMYANIKEGSWFTQFGNGCNPWMARYVYGSFFLIANLLAWAVRDYGYTTFKSMQSRSTGPFRSGSEPTQSASAIIGGRNWPETASAEETVLSSAPMLWGLRVELEESIMGGGRGVTMVPCHCQILDQGFADGTDMVGPTAIEVRRPSLQPLSD